MKKLLLWNAIGILGGGGLPAISVSPSSWDFGSTPLGSPVTKEFTIENTGTAALVITLPITMVGAEASAFTVTVQPPVTSLAPGASTTFTVQADADGFGTYDDASISIISNASGSPTLVPVVANITYLLQDLFTTAASAPLVSPRAAEPTGTLTLTDTGNKLSISAGRMLAASAQSAFADPRVVSAVLDRTPGRALYIKGTGSSWRGGWANSADNAPRWGFLLTGSGLYCYDNASTGGVIVPVNGATEYEYLIFQSGNAGYLAIKGGAWADWTLVWIADVEDAGNLNKSATVKLYLDIAASFSVDEVRIADYWGEFGRFIGWANYSQSLPTLPLSGTGSADQIFKARLYPPASSTFDMKFRWVDDDNCLIVRGDQAASTIKLFERNAGVEAQLGPTGTQTWVANQQYIVEIRAEGQRISVLSETTIKITYTTASFQQTETGIKITETGGVIARYVQAWPLAMPSIPAMLGTKSLNIFAFGDSKTAAAADSFLGYPPRLNELVEATGRGCYERPLRYGLGGGTSVTIAAAIVATLAARTHIPDFITFNVGANDATAGTTEANFKAACRTLFDAMLVKWPSTKIYCMRPWVRDYLSQCNSIATWLSDLVAEAAYIGKVYLGPDERIFLENGDDGVAYTADGVHPNAAGYAITAAQWKTTLGL